MGLDIEESVQRTSARPSEGESLIEQLLAVRNDHYWQGLWVTDQADLRLALAEDAGPGRCVAAVVQATPRQLGRLYKPLLYVGDEEAAWAALLAAGCGGGHPFATREAVDLLGRRRRRLIPHHDHGGPAAHWVCGAETVAAIERGLGFPPGDFSGSPDTYDLDMRCTIVAALRPLSDRELHWWASRHPLLAQPYLDNRRPGR